MSLGTRPHYNNDKVEYHAGYRGIQNISLELYNERRSKKPEHISLCLDVVFRTKNVAFHGQLKLTVVEIQVSYLVKF